MKCVIVFALMIPALSMQAQNIGINQTNPAEKLDVNGNINITGTIKTNGTAGTTGQMLMSTGTGMTWGSIMNYKKCVIYYTPGNSYGFTVPAGVTEVMVELWGGGSGGTTLCGGTSGGYARTVQSVTPGGSLPITVGAVGSYGSTTSTGGGQTRVDFPLLSSYIVASGGGGVQAAQTGYVGGGTGTVSNAFFSYGNPGQKNISTFGMKNATTYVEIRKCGTGGAPIGMFNSVPVEGDVAEYDNGVAFSNFQALASFVPSAGGAAGRTFGYDGGPGMVIIWFNN
jgi:hypothetical protein